MIRMFEIRSSWYVPYDYLKTKSRDDRYIRLFVKERPIESQINKPVIIICDLTIDHAIYYQDDFWTIYDFALDYHNVIEWIDIGLVPVDGLKKAKQLVQMCSIPG